MKIAIFVDGKNFYMGCQRYAAGRRLNFPRLATWLKEQAGGSLLVGCHYYTGIENNERGASLLGFLAMLETQRGYFVHRFPRKTESFQCGNCGETHVFTREKTGSGRFPGPWDADIGRTGRSAASSPTVSG